MGNFQMEWFDHSSESVAYFARNLFVMYMVIVFLLCINVLIAVVSDSYDYAMFRARTRFSLREWMDEVFCRIRCARHFSRPFLGNGFVMDALVAPCVLLIFANPVVASFTFTFWDRRVHSDG